jgi:hypothetical protein
MDNGGGLVQMGVVEVQTTSGTGFSIEHWADRCLAKIVHVAEDSASPIRDQAIAFRGDIRQVLIHYITNAVKSDRTTLYNLLLQQGEKDMAELLRKL